MDVQFRHPDWSSNEVMQHCKTLKRLLQMLPLTNPSEEDLLEILKTNVKLFAAFVEQETQSLIEDIESNQQRLRNIANPTNSCTENDQDMAESKPRDENQTIETSQMANPISFEVPSHQRQVHPTTYDQDESTKKVNGRIQVWKRKFIENFGIGPMAVWPFCPSGAYSFGLPVCYYEKMSCNAVFVYRFMMMGDGYIFNIAREVKTNNMKFSLKAQLYKEFLTISELIKSLARFHTLPKCVLLCIGNTDCRSNKPYDQIRYDYGQLLNAFRRKGTKKVYVLPIFEFEDMSHLELRKKVASMQRENWSKVLNGHYVNLQDFVDGVVKAPEGKDEDNKLCFTSKQTLDFISSLRGYFEPKR